MKGRMRIGMLAAAVAAVVGAAPAAAAAPSWFERADRNDDRRVTWSEYRRTQSDFQDHDLDGDGRIERLEGRGRSQARGASSWSQVAAGDQNRDGVVTRAEYEGQLRSQFDRFDRNGDGVLTLYEVGGGTGTSRGDRSGPEWREQGGRRG